jgi:hypothetical protein
VTAGTKRPFGSLRLRTAQWYVPCIDSRNDPRNELGIPGRPSEQTRNELERCQARPAAARRGFREDVLCASYANTTVEFRDQLVAVCRMHEATYKRWGTHAECNAAELWEWPA